MDSESQEPGKSGQSWIPLVVLCGAQFMLIVDVVIVNVALPPIRSSLNLPDSRLQLVAVAYTLTFGSLLIVFGRIGDQYGRRRLLLLGLPYSQQRHCSRGVPKASGNCWFPEQLRELGPRSFHQPHWRY